MHPSLGAGKRGRKSSKSNEKTSRPLPAWFQKLTKYILRPAGLWGLLGKNGRVSVFDAHGGRQLGVYDSQQKIFFTRPGGECVRVDRWANLAGIVRGG